jgi:hypothetical protein
LSVVERVLYPLPNPPRKGEGELLSTPLRKGEGEFPKMKDICSDC